MAHEPTVFLSASVPLPDRSAKYYQTADVIAIREAVRALALLVVPKGTIVFGGHPAITPLIRVVAQSLGIKVGDHVILYQSALFKPWFPPDNVAFERVEVTPAVGTDKDASLDLMRSRMLGEHAFKAGIFIGGMEGVEEEFDLFRTRHTNAVLLPIASTGGAAKIVYDRKGPFPTDLETDLGYGALFRRHLGL